MAVNELLPFASSSANILTQAEYASDTQRTSGNVPGVARSKLVNKAARQSAFVASMIGQFIADKAGVDVLDDADIAGLVADFVLALNSATRGLMASTLQAQAQTDDSVLISPKKLADAFQGGNQTLAAVGRQRLPGGMIEQWGKQSISLVGGATVSSSITFPQPFPNACLAVNCNVVTLTPGGVTTQPGNVPTTTGFDQYFYSSTTSGTTTFFWRAVGW